MDPALANALRLCRAPDDPPVAAIRTDLTVDGKFGESWAVLTADRLLILNVQNGSSAVHRNLPLETIRQPRLQSSIGSSLLLAEVDGKLVELIRFRQGGQKSFQALVKHLLAAPNGSSGLPPDLSLPKVADSKETLPSPRQVMWRLLKYLKPFRKQAFLMSVTILASTAVGLITPYLTRPLVDKVLVPAQGTVPPGRVTLLLIIGAAMLACQLVGLGLNVLQGRLASRLTHQLANNLRMDVFQHIQFLSVGFFARREVGSLVSRITQDTAEMESALTLNAQFMIANLLTILGIGAVLCVLNWKLFLLIMLPLPLTYFVSRVIYRRMIMLWNRWWHHRGRLHATLTECLFGIRVIKAFARESAEVDRLKNCSNDLAKSGQEADQVWVTVFPILNLITGLGALIVWMAGGHFVLSGAFSLGTLMTFLAYVAMFYSPFQFLNRTPEWLGRTVTAAGRVFSILDSPVEIPEPRHPQPHPHIKGSIEFRHVSFGYEPSALVLKDIDFRVRAGEMIGLVGHSGAGKSTLIHLLCRFYDVGEGAVIIDDTDIRDFAQRDLRSQIGMVSQDTFLFNATIAQNIAYARPNASPQDIIQAAKAANAHHFILAKSDGYDTLVGERGLQLSTGERQRIAIARAILHNPRILLLDEATSSVDLETERQIQEALAWLVKGRTTIAIAHRLGTLRQADRLIVLKNGAIAEIGTHEELLENNGEFSRLVHSQDKAPDDTFVLA